MTRGTSSSQVGLFSTQISEQIVRLRALSRNQDGPSEAHLVDLRRAIMATRLLAGSSRILQLDALQSFLEELLLWLQSVEQSTQPLNTTQSLILESVVELEESLMIHLDEVEQETGADLSPFQSQIDDLLTLIRHNTESLEGAIADAEASEETAPTPAPDEPAVAGPEGFDALVESWEQAVAAARAPEEIEGLTAALEPGLGRLRALLIRLRAKAESLDAAFDPAPMAEGLVRAGKADDDPLFGPAVKVLRESTGSLGMALEVDVYGDSGVIAAALRERLGEILSHLVVDVVDSFDALDDPGDRTLHVGFAVREDAGRALIEVADDAPRVHGGSILGDPDHLAVLQGLRRARTLLDQTPGLVRLSEGDDDGRRFVLSVPLDPARPRFRVIAFEGARVAVPASLVDEVIDASGLLYETDESGESVERDGRSVPLADLAFFVGALVPARSPNPCIAVIGSVEKRVGIGCQDEGRVVEIGDLVDAPAGWDAVSYGAITVDGEAIPVLDVKRLLGLRFRPGEALDVPGALADPRVDSFVPAEDEELPPEEVDFEPEAHDEASEESTDETDDDAVVEIDELLEAAPDDPPAPREAFHAVVLVNQSEFRRRDLARTLGATGLEVRIEDDLASASRAITRDGVDLLVTDLRLGQGSGESFHSLRKKHPDLTIVLTSSVAQQYAGELATKTGAHRCWLDPYRKADLDAVLGELTA